MYTYSLHNKILMKTAGTISINIIHIKVIKTTNNGTIRVNTGLAINILNIQGQSIIFLISSLTKILKVGNNCIYL